MKTKSLAHLSLFFHILPYEEYLSLFTFTFHLPFLPIFKRFLWEWAGRFGSQSGPSRPDLSVNHKKLLVRSLILDFHVEISHMHIVQFQGDYYSVIMSQTVFTNVACLCICTEKSTVNDILWLSQWNSMTGGFESNKEFFFTVIRLEKNFILQASIFMESGVIR